MAREDEIRLIAYGIWEEEGCWDGRDMEHWFRAEMIWGQNQKEEAAPTGARTRQKRTAKGSKKNKPAEKKS